MMKKRAAFFLGIVVVLSSLTACIAIAFSGLRDDLKKADLGVVLGNRVDPDGKPSAMLKARLDQAVLLYDQRFFHTLIVSGGRGKEGFDEAEVMRRYLVSQGVDPNAIVEDHEGKTTQETAINTARYMEEHHLRSVVIVSQYYHMPRCRLAFERVGIKEIYTSHAPFFSMRDFYSLPREVIGYAEYYLKPSPLKTGP